MLGRTIGVRLSEADEAKLRDEAKRLQHKVCESGGSTLKIGLSDVLREVVRRGLDEVSGTDVARPVYTQSPAPAASIAPPEPPTAGVQGARVERVRKTDGVPMRRTTVWLKAGMARRLALFCADRDISQTDVIEAALVAHLDRLEASK